MNDQNRDPETPASSVPTWEDQPWEDLPGVAAYQRRFTMDPERWKALSESPREYPPVLPSRQEILDALPCQPCPQSGKCALNGCARENLIPPAQREHTGTPVSFLRWCGHQTIHSPHGRCGGVK